MNENIQVLDIQLNNITVKDAMKCVMSYMETEPVSVIEMVTMNTLARFQDAEGTDDIFRQFDLVLASDRGILEAAGVTEERYLKEADDLLFIKMVMKYLHRNDTRVILLAQSQSDLEKLEQYVEENYSHIRVIESATIEEQGTSDDMLLNLVNGAETACILSVLPSPLEEEFISRNKALVNARLWLGLGNLLNEMKKKKTRLWKVKEFILRQILKSEMAKKGENA